MLISPNIQHKDTVKQLANILLQLPDGSNKLHRQLCAGSARAGKLQLVRGGKAKRHEEHMVFRSSGAWGAIPAVGQSIISARWKALLSRAATTGRQPDATAMQLMDDSITCSGGGSKAMVLCNVSGRKMQNWM